MGKVENFADKIIMKIKEKNNWSCAGLDPKLEYVPEFLKDGQNAAGAVLMFNKALIDELYDIVPAVKLQLACYEMYGVEGIKTYYDTIRYAKEKDLVVIADAKKNDIGSSAEMYAKAHFSTFGADALTVNGYLGIDGIEPFLEHCKNNGKGMFVLVKTSNKSAGQLQDIETKDGNKIYEIMAAYVDDWGSGLVGESGYSSVGAVVGATYPEQAAFLRKVMPRTLMLIPGYGAQGGTATDAVASFDNSKQGGIINASRSIMCAYKSKRWEKEFSDREFAKAARAEAERMRDEINNALLSL